MNYLHRPVFVVVEGLDGVGKTTLVSELARRLEADVLTTPSVELRDVRRHVDLALADSPAALQAWYAATVLAASDAARGRLAAGRSVVVDRYWLSTLAYSELRGDRMRLPEVERRLLQPDGTLYLYADRKTRRQRILTRGEGLQPHDRASVTREGHRLVDGAFRSLAAHPLAGEFCTVDAGARPREAVLHECLNLVTRRLDRSYAEGRA